MSRRDLSRIFLIPAGANRALVYTKLGPGIPLFLFLV